MKKKINNDRIPAPAAADPLIARIDAATKDLGSDFASVLVLCRRDDQSGCYFSWCGGYHNAVGMVEEFKSRTLPRS